MQLSVFIFEPGTYRCFDPTPAVSPFIFLSWHSENPSADYLISPTMEAGACELVVDSVKPRFRVQLSATVPRVSGDAGPAELAITADIDVVVPAAGGCS